MKTQWWAWPWRAVRGWELEAFRASWVGCVLVHSQQPDVSLGVVCNRAPRGRLAHMLRLLRTPGARLLAGSLRRELHVG
jgi:hypothetical protein